MEEIILEPEGQDTTGLQCIGREVTDTVDYRPGKPIIRRIRPKYAREEAGGSLGFPIPAIILRWKSWVA